MNKSHHNSLLNWVHERSCKPKLSLGFQRSLFWLLAVVVSFVVPQAYAINRFEETHNFYFLKGQYQVLEDHEGRHSPEIALKILREQNGGMPNPPLEYSSDILSVWTLFEMTNASPQNELMLHQIWLTSSRAFKVDGQKLVPLELLPFRYPLFRLPLARGETAKILMETRQRLGGIRLNIRISTVRHFWEIAQYENVIFAITMYVMAVLGLISLILSFAFRQRFYFFNACYILLFDLFLLIMHGLLNVSYYPLVVALAPLMAVALSRFNVHFFDLDRTSRPAWIQNAAVTTSFAFFTFWWWSDMGQPLIYLTLTPVTIVSIYLAYHEVRKGDLSATVLLLGWGMLILSVLVGMYHVFVDDSDISSWLCLFSFLGETILFNIALAIKMRLKERTATQLNNHMFTQLRKVFYPHQIDLMRKGRPLEATMPVGDGEACVICFDIIGSSSIVHPEARAFLLNVIKHCQESMQSGYDGNALRAAAFRIKEMGDGFLCSVGYPFLPLKDNVADAALELSHEFYKVFLEEVQTLGYERPVGCSIAIAHGPLSSFFPQAGTREYDLYGKAIILATRYEQMRKLIFSQLKGSILIIDERTLHLVSPELRASFSVFDMKARNLIVRDDPSAQRLYYQLLSEPSPHAVMLKFPESA